MRAWKKPLVAFLAAMLVEVDLRGPRSLFAIYISMRWPKSKTTTTKFQLFCVCVYHSLFIFSETPKHFIVCHLLLTLNKFGFVKYSNVGRASWNVCSTFWVDLFWIFLVFFFWWPVKRIPGPPMARHTSRNKTKRSRVRNFKSIWWFPTQIRSRRDWLVD